MNDLFIYYIRIHKGREGEEIAPLCGEATACSEDLRDIFDILTTAWGEQTKSFLVLGPVLTEVFTLIIMVFYRRLQRDEVNA